MKKKFCFIFIILPFLWLFITNKVYCKSQVEDFYFLNQPSDEVGIVNSGKDLLQSYFIFIFSTWLNFETKYWALELLRKGLNPNSQLNAHSVRIVEIASIWTASSVARNSKYQQWPSNKSLQYLLEAGGCLGAAVSRSLVVEGITVPTSIFVYMSVMSLTKTLSGTVATSILRKANHDPVEISLHYYDMSESAGLSIGIVHSIGYALFAVLTRYQVSPVKSSVCASATALSVTAVAAFSQYMTEPDVSLMAILSTLATAGITTTIMVTFIINTSDETGAEAMAGAGAVFGIVAGAGIHGLTMAIIEAGDRGGVVAATTAIAAAAAATGGGFLVGTKTLFIMLGSDPIYHTRYVTAFTIGAASIFAIVNCIANYLNTGAPLDQTLSEISWSYWWSDGLIY